jgi:hypothetical protein
MDYYPYEILEDSPMTHPAIAEAARNLICGEGLYDYDATDLERATSIITAAVERVCGERLEHQALRVQGELLHDMTGLLQTIVARQGCTGPMLQHAERLLKNAGFCVREG